MTFNEIYSVFIRLPCGWRDGWPPTGRTDEVEIICPQMGFVFKRRIGIEPYQDPGDTVLGEFHATNNGQNRIPANRNFLEFGQKHNHREIVSPVQLKVACWGDSFEN